MGLGVVYRDVIIEATNVNSIAKGAGTQTEEKAKVRCLEVVLLFTCCLLRTTATLFCDVRVESLQTTFPRVLPADFLLNSTKERHWCDWRDVR